ncbi:MAG: ATP-binding protein [Bacteroidales bacterium]|nr:ATP-binding protein [Bacteroidales bacterium]
MNKFRKGQVLTLPVDGTTKVINNRKCYIVTLDDGRQYPISLLRFQLNEDIPATLRCLVKDYNENTGDLTLVQDFSPYIKQFYKIGSVYDFVVTKIIPHGGENRTYLLSDTYGFIFHLDDSHTRLYAYQHVKCKVTDQSGTRLSLKVETGENNSIRRASSTLPHKMTEALKGRQGETEWKKGEFVELLFGTISGQTFDEVCTEWLQHEISGRDDQSEMIEEMQSDILWLLEKSDILKQTSGMEREMLQERLSASIDVSSRFTEAIQIVGQESHEQYIADLLSKLEMSGYIYQPQHKLGVLVTLFSLKPELMKCKMGDIFRIIELNPLEYWKQEPFRSAFIKLIEMYIRSEKANADYASAASSESIHQIIKALAMEQCLVQTLNEEQQSVLPCDMQLNRAMLFRYASFVSPTSPRTLLERSFRCLMGSGATIMRFSWEDISKVEVLVEKLAAITDQDDDSFDDNIVMKTYKGNKSQLRIGDSGIQVLPINEDDSEPVLPEDLLPWHQQQIMVNGGLNEKIKLNEDDLTSYQKLWNEIEVALNSEKVQQNTTPEFVKMLPEQGDEVDIIIDGQLDDTSEPTFHCKIVMDNVKGEGTIVLSEIVKWNPRIIDKVFVDDDGNPLVLPAKVISIKPDGECRFTMTKLIREYIHDEVSYGNTFQMLVKSRLGNGLNGVSAEGYPLNATIPSNIVVDSEVKAGDYILVEVEQDDDTRRSNVSTTFIKHIARPNWDEGYAFYRLMQNYAVDAIHDGQSNDKEVLQADAQLDNSYVHELMLLMDRQAAVENTMRAYSYLGMARIIAMLTDDKQSMQYYHWRMELMKMLHEFSINEKVDEEKLREIEKAGPEMFMRESQLHFRFMQLLIISRRNHPEHNAELWNTIANDSELGLKELASLVLAYNLLGDFASVKSRAEIDTKIFEHLNLKQRKSAHKNYGKENKQVEFKTSMVYPPDNNMRPDLAQQVQTILKVVCAFLNTQGGTLYIGVNNEGTAIGIGNDLAYRQFQYSQDKYDIFFHNQVKQYLGLIANSLIETSFDENEDGCVVYIVKVKPCFNAIITLHTKVYERQGSSCEPLNGDYLRQFRVQRLKNAASMPASNTEFNFDEIINNLETKPADVEEETVAESAEPQPVDEIPATAEPEPEPEPASEPERQSKDENRELAKIATGQLRNNVLFNWDEGFEEPIAYLQFLPDSKYQIVNECYADDAELTIAIHEHERNAYLLMAYEDGMVTKVALKEILEKEQYKEFQRADAKLAFACPCFDGDILFTVVRAENGLVLYRTDKVSEIEKQNITQTGSVLHDLLEYKIIQADIVSAVSADIYKQIPSRSLGISVVKSDGVELRKQMAELGYDIMTI